MGWVAALVGGVAGTSIHMMSNATRKIPLSRSKYSRYRMRAGGGGAEWIIFFIYLVCP